MDYKLIPKHYKGNTVKQEAQKEAKQEQLKPKAPTVNKDRPQQNRRYNYGRTTPAYPIPYRQSNPLLAYNPFMRNK